MIFKTYETDLDGITNKIGFSKRSFAEWGTQVKTSFNEGATVAEKFKNALFTAFTIPKESSNNWIKNSFGEIITKNNIDSLIPEIDTNRVDEIIAEINAVNKANASWNDYYKTLHDGEDFVVDLIKNTDDLSKITGEDLVKANQQARASALSHNEAIKAQTFSAKAGKVAFQALTTAANMLVAWAISKGIELIVKGIDNYIHRVEKANEAIEDSRSGYEEAKSQIESMNSQLETTRQKISELESKGPLSFTDEAELERLRQQNDELERNIILQEKKKKNEASQTVNEIQENKEDLFDDFDDVIQDFNNYKKEYEENDKRGRKGVLNGNITPESYESIMRDMEGVLLSEEEKVLEKIETFEKYKKDIINKYNTDDISQYDASDKKLYEDIVQQLQNAYHAIYSDSEYNKFVIEPIFNKNEFKDLDDQLLEYFISGGSTNLSALEEKFGSDIITSLRNACNNAGVDFNKMIQDLYENSQNNLDRIAPIVKEPNSAFDAQQNSVSKSIRDFIENDLSKEDRTLLLKAEIPEDQKFKTINDVKEFIDSLNDIPDNNPILSLEDAKKETQDVIDEYKLLQEVLSDTSNISIETYEKLLSCSSKYSTAIRTENGRITLNTTKLKQVAKARQIDTQETIKETLALKKQEWVQWQNKIKNYNGTLLESIEGKYKDIDALQAEITQYELLVNSIDNAASAFDRFKAAQQTNDQDMYDTAKDAFDVLKEYSSKKGSDNYGKYNRDEFQEAAMLLMDNDTYKKALNAKDLEEYQSVVDGFVKSISPLFDENNAKSASELFDEVDKIIESGDVPKADTDWAERLGISKEAFNALKQLANQYDYNNKEVFESYQLNTLDEYQSKLSNVKAAQQALNECTDTTSKEYMKLSKDLDTAQQKLSEFENETTSNVTDAWKSYENSFKGHGEVYYSGQSFSDYLKDTLDFDENDITGVTDVLLGQIDSLQEKMEHIPDTKGQEVYAKQIAATKDILSGLGYSYEEVSEKKDKFESPTTKKNTTNVDAYKKMAEQAAQFKETIAKSEIGSEAYQSAVEGLQQVQSVMEGLKEPVRIEIQTNIDEIDSKISAVESRISSLNQVMANTTNASAQSAIQSEINRAQNQKASLEGQKAELEQTMKIVLDSSEVDGYNPDPKDLPVTATLNSSAVDGYTPPKKTMDVSVKLNTSAIDSFNPSVSKNSAGGVDFASGTVGNAFASGYNGLPSKEKGALRSEYGQKELTVYPNGTYEVTDKPTLSDLPKGTVIFNEEQTERILKGKAHADGTVGNAFGSGTGTKVNTINLKDVSTNNKAIKNAKNASDTISDAIDETAEEAKEASEEIFDWIERRTKKFQRLFDKWLKQAETALTKGFIDKYYKKAAASMSNLLKTYGNAYNRYMKQANDVGLDEENAKKVRNGTIDIETITDADLADKIQKYQEWYVTCHIA